MNVLYIAFSCSPYHGSEDKIGWNIPLESAKTNRVFVITREEQRQYVEKYLQDYPDIGIRFYYVDIPQIYHKLLSKVPYTPKLNLFHKYAYRVARQICAEEQIDVIHQITPVEFRSIGNYGKIPNVKFVCGPIAGGQTIPRQLSGYLGSHRFTEIARYCGNQVVRIWLSLFRKLQYCDCLLFANHETSRFLCRCGSDGLDCRVLTDVAISEEMDSSADFQGDFVRFAVIGRLVYLKGHRLLFDALRRLPSELPYECRIVGAGDEEEKLRKLVRQYGLSERVNFVGIIPHTEISEVYKKLDVLIMPSFREATGTVILEAMAFGVPVITINRFGGATILDEYCGWLYDGNTKEEYIENLKNAIIQCIQNPEEVRRRGENAQNRASEYTWTEKMKQYQAIYDSVVNAEK